MVDDDAFREAGLIHPDVDPSQRLDLLRFLASLGVTLEEMTEASTERKLVGLATNRAIFPEPPRYTFDDVSERSNLSNERLGRLMRAAGLAVPDPGARTFTDADIAVFKRIAEFVEQLGEDAVMRLARTIGSSVARIAEGVLATYESAVGTPMRAAGATEVERAAAGAAIGGMLPVLMELIDAQLRHHLQAARRRRWETEVARDRDAVQMVLGFADLVGSTEWAGTLDQDALAHAIAEFEGSSTDVIVRAGGRAVKVIGDEIMFAVAEPAAAIAIARALVDTFGSHPVLPPVRVGLAYGSVIPQDGDYYGAAVNLAARAVRDAEPGQILLDSDLARALPSERVTSAGARYLKGFTGPVELFAVE